MISNIIYLRIFWILDKNKNNIIELLDVLCSCLKFVDLIPEYKVKSILFKNSFFLLL